MRCLLALFLATSWVTAAEPEPFDQSKIPIEMLPTDPSLAKVVFVAGLASPKLKTGEHEYLAGCAALAKLVEQTPGIAAVIVKNGKPTNPETLRGAKAVVLFLEGAEAHAAVRFQWVRQIDELAAAGAGIVHLHSAIDYPKDYSERARGWAGAAWEKGPGARAHWVAEFDSFPAHPIFRGVGKFKIDDGWLWNNRFVPELKNVTPLLRTVNPKEAAGKTTKDGSIVAWAFDRPATEGAKAGRSFTFTGGHLHESLKLESYRRFLVNGILWSAGREIPEAGSPVAVTDAELMRNFDPKPAKK